jgi:hypothetical protein
MQMDFLNMLGVFGKMVQYRLLRGSRARVIIQGYFPKIRSKVQPVSDEFILNQLEDLAHKLGIRIRYENLNLEESSRVGGLCRLKGEYVLLVQAQAPLEEKIQVLTEVLGRFPLGDLYIRPVIRALLGGPKE